MATILRFGIVGSLAYELCSVRGMEEAIDLVRRVFPGRTVEVEGEGQLSSAFRVDDDLVVRVPRHAFGVERLRHEVALLAAIRAEMSVAVPEIVDVVLDQPACAA